MTTQEQIEALQEIQQQCDYVIDNSTNKDLVAFAKIIRGKTQ